MSVAPASTAIAAGEYSWDYTYENGKSVFAGTGTDTVYLASNKGQENKFRAYKTTTVTGNPNGYPYQFSLYKLDESGEEPNTGTETPTESPTTETEAPTAQPTETPTTPATDPTNPTQPSETITPVANGDKVVIYAPEYNKALSGNYNGYYNTAADVTVSDDGTVTGYTDAEVWTVIDNGDGTYSFSYNDKNIGMGDSYSSMPLGEKNDKWTIEEASNGTYYIKNSVRNAYIEYYASKNNWSGYGQIASGSEGMFQLKFYKVPSVPTYTVTILINGQETTNYVKEGGTCYLNTKKTISVPQDDGSTKTLTFKYWEENGKPISFSQGYGFYVYSDRTINAVFADNEEPAQPTINITKAFSYTKNDKNYVAFDASRDVPEGYTVVQHGVLFGASKSTFGDDKANDNLKFADETNFSLKNRVMQCKAKSTTVRGLVRLSVNVGSTLDGVVYARGYVVVKDSVGNQSVIYSDVVSRSFNE